MDERGYVTGKWGGDAGSRLTTRNQKYITREWLRGPVTYSAGVVKKTTEDGPVGT